MSYDEEEKGSWGDDDFNEDESDILGDEPLIDEDDETDSPFDEDEN